MRTSIALGLIAASFVVVFAGCNSSNALSGQPIPQITPASSTLNRLTKIATIGSTVDPQNGDQNPYGLAIAPTTTGRVTAGDLIVCNFSDGPNTEGNGTTVIGLHPVPGAAPYRIAQDPSLRGCDALSIAASGAIWTANDVANDVAIVSPTGAVQAVPSSGSNPWGRPWGTAIPSSSTTATTLYVSNQLNGSIDRLTANGSAIAAARIATGFATNGGVPGAILAPSGLTYDSATDTLYVVDGNANRVVALANVGAIGANGVSVNPSGSGFGGPSAASARILASGAPLNGPISAALLPTGNLIVGNTLDPNGTNLLVEISPNGGVLATKNVDTGAAGALFGIAAGGTASSPKLYFNDDNDNTVKVLSP